MSEQLQNGIKRSLYIDLMRDMSKERLIEAYKQGLTEDEFMVYIPTLTIKQIMKDNLLGVLLDYGWYKVITSVSADLAQEYINSDGHIEYYIGLKEDIHVYIDELSRNEHIPSEYYGVFASKLVGHAHQYINEVITKGSVTMYETNGITEYMRVLGQVLTSPVLWDISQEDAKLVYALLMDLFKLFNGDYIDDIDSIRDSYLSRLHIYILPLMGHPNIIISSGATKLSDSYLDGGRSHRKWGVL